MISKSIWNEHLTGYAPFLWFVWDDAHLSQTAKDTITDPNNRKLVSVASVWEIAIKVSLQKLDLGMPYLPFMQSSWQSIYLRFYH